MLVERCPACGSENPDGFKFCAECHSCIDPHATPITRVIPEVRRAGGVREPFDIARELGDPAVQSQDYRRLFILSGAALAVIILAIIIATGRRNPSAGRDDGAVKPLDLSERSMDDNKRGTARPAGRAPANNAGGPSSLMQPSAPPPPAGAPSAGGRVSARYPSPSPTAGSPVTGARAPVSSGSYTSSRRSQPAVGNMESSSLPQSRAPIYSAPSPAGGGNVSSPSSSATSGRTPARTTDLPAPGREDLAYREWYASEQGPKATIIVHGQRTDAVPAAGTPASRISFKEGMADTHIRLGEFKEAAAILKELLKADLKPADRLRIREKLRRCGG